MGREGDSFLVLEADGRFFGLDVRRIESVIGFREPIPIPRAPAGFLGGLLHHGEFLGVIHLAEPLGLDARVEADRAVIAVLDWDGGAVGLAAERSHGLFLPEADAEEVRVLGRWEGPFHARTVRFREKDVHLLDLDGLFSALGSRIAGNAPRAAEG